MNDLESKIFNLLKSKKSSKKCAEKLGITEELYNEIKHKILNKEKSEYYNLEKGEAKLDCITYKEPKSPEEIIKLLKIDTSKWKLSQYWNKQTSSYWKISALVTKLNPEESSFKDFINSWKPKSYNIESNFTPTKEIVCGILSVQDIHFGKENNENIDVDFINSINYLINKSNSIYSLDKLFFVIGGDILNMDTFQGTTTNGTILDNSLKATNAYIQAFDTIHYAINFLIKFCKTLVVVYIPGNHDRLSSFHLALGLSKSINSKSIEWDVEYKERKVHIWEDNFLAFEHGDVKSKQTPLVYATEFSNEWGKANYRTLFTGHYHQTKKIEYISTQEEIGFIHKTLPSLSNTDYYHYHNKYVGNKRAAVLELQGKNKGQVSEFIYSI